MVDEAGAYSEPTYMAPTGVGSGFNFVADPSLLGNGMPGFPAPPAPAAAFGAHPPPPPMPPAPMPPAAAAQSLPAHYTNMKATPFQAAAPADDGETYAL